MTSLGSVPPEVLIVDANFSGGFEFHVYIPNVAFKAFRSKAGSETLSDLADKVRASRADECRRNDFDYVNGSTAAERDDFMIEVAHAGASLFHAMIDSEADRAMFRTILADHAGAKIRVVADANCFPWEALCLAEDPSRATYEDFLGWNHVVIREIDAPYIASREPIKAKNFTVGVIEDDELKSVEAGKNRAALNAMGSSHNQIPMPLLVNPHGVDVFRSFFIDDKAPKRVLQFDCHVIGTDVIRASKLRVTKTYPVHYLTMANQLRIFHEPFVFLNFCSAGTVGWRDSEGYAAHVLAAGANLVLAAEADLGDGFMSDFSAQFYSKLASCVSVADTLLLARRAVLSKIRNPSALFYGIYGDSRHAIDVPGTAADPASLTADCSDIWPLPAPAKKSQGVTK